jgi:predicted GNAT family acetyltransferase
VLGVAALRKGEIVGMAGASADSPTMWQIGINVEPACRGEGLASLLVTLLKNEILKRGVLPFYGTALSHIASQRTALVAGFLPAWAELVAEAGETL